MRRTRPRGSLSSPAHHTIGLNPMLYFMAERVRIARCTSLDSVVHETSGRALAVPLFSSLSQSLRAGGFVHALYLPVPSMFIALSVAFSRRTSRSSSFSARTWPDGRWCQCDVSLEAASGWRRICPEHPGIDRQGHQRVLHPTCK